MRPSPDFVSTLAGLAISVALVLGVHGFVSKEFKHAKTDDVIMFLDMIAVIVIISTFVINEILKVRYRIGLRRPRLQMDARDITILMLAIWASAMLYTVAVTLPHSALPSATTPAAKAPVEK